MHQCVDPTFVGSYRINPSEGSVSLIDTFNDQRGEEDAWEIVYSSAICNVVQDLRDKKQILTNVAELWGKIMSQYIEKSSELSSHTIEGRFVRSTSGCM